MKFIMSGTFKICPIGEVCDKHIFGRKNFNLPKTAVVFMKQCDKNSFNHEALEKSINYISKDCWNFIISCAEVLGGLVIQAYTPPLPFLAHCLCNSCDKFLQYDYSS